MLKGSSASFDFLISFVWQHDLYLLIQNCSILFLINTQRTVFVKKIKNALILLVRYYMCLFSSFFVMKKVWLMFIWRAQKVNLHICYDFNQKDWKPIIVTFSGKNIIIYRFFHSSFYIQNIYWTNITCLI